MPLRCFASLLFAIAAALALALVAPKEMFRRLAGGAVACAAAVAGVAPAFFTAAAREIAVAVASPLTASATAALATAGKLAGTTPCSCWVSYCCSTCCWRQGCSCCCFASGLRGAVSSPLYPSFSSPPCSLLPPLIWWVLFALPTVDSSCFCCCYGGPTEETELLGLKNKPCPWPPHHALLVQL